MGVEGATRETQGICTVRTRGAAPEASSLLISKICFYTFYSWFSCELPFLDFVDSPFQVHVFFFFFNDTGSARFAIPERSGPAFYLGNVLHTSWGNFRGRKEIPRGSVELKVITETGVMKPIRVSSERKKKNPSRVAESANALQVQLLFKSRIPRHIFQFVLVSPLQILCL